eukprot:TRINITY_DN34970_c0_g2_i1.p1 TRINITY_DN34970_c0_g2~~TRINITY_DN34970_c0_g2_i1.p1  ORF type:complete len:573 (-),score=72.77 TRINITY_DN34970_c0_g2_i1:33-1751(-)
MVGGITWAPLSRGEALPEGVVVAGETDSDGVTIIGRFAGEAGKINTADGKTVQGGSMWSFWGASRVQATTCEILRCSVDVDWVPIERGQPIPRGAVQAGISRSDGLNYVARYNGEAGKINMDGGNMYNFWGHHWKQQTAAEILVVREDHEKKEATSSAAETSFGRPAMTPNAGYLPSEPLETKVVSLCSEYPFESLDAELEAARRMKSDPNWAALFWHRRRYLDSVRRRGVEQTLHNAVYPSEYAYPREVAETEQVQAGQFLALCQEAAHLNVSSSFAHIYLPQAILFHDLDDTLWAGGGEKADIAGCDRTVHAHETYPMVETVFAKILGHDNYNVAVTAAPPLKSLEYVTGNKHDFLYQFSHKVAPVEDTDTARFSVLPGLGSLSDVANSARVLAHGTMERAWHKLMDDKQHPERVVAGMRPAADMKAQRILEWNHLFPEFALSHCALQIFLGDDGQGDMLTVAKLAREHGELFAFFLIKRVRIGSTKPHSFYWDAVSPHPFLNVNSPELQADAKMLKQLYDDHKLFFFSDYHEAMPGEDATPELPLLQQPPFLAKLEVLRKDEGVGPGDH